MFRDDGATSPGSVLIQGEPGRADEGEVEVEASWAEDGLPFAAAGDMERLTSGPRRDEDG